MKNKNLATRSILHVKDIVPCTVAPPYVKILVEISTAVGSRKINVGSRKQKKKSREQRKKSRDQGAEEIN